VGWREFGVVFDALEDARAAFGARVRHGLARRSAGSALAAEDGVAGGAALGRVRWRAALVSGLRVSENKQKLYFLG
jgi:hypothetical protein